MLAFALLAALQLPAGAVAPVDPQARAAEIALKSFLAGCLQTLPAAHSAAEYAGGADQLGRMLAGNREVARLPVKVEGVGGRACRVTLVAAPRYVDAQWAGVSGAVKSCTAQAATMDDIRYACVAQGARPAYEVAFHRSRSGADARLVSTVTYVGR